MSFEGRLGGFNYKKTRLNYFFLDFATFITFCEFTFRIFLWLLLFFLLEIWQARYGSYIKCSLFSCSTCSLFICLKVTEDYQLRTAMKQLWPVLKHVFYSSTRKGVDQYATSVILHGVY